MRFLLLSILGGLLLCGCDGGGAGGGASTDGDADADSDGDSDADSDGDSDGDGDGDGDGDSDSDGDTDWGIPVESCDFDYDQVFTLWQPPEQDFLAPLLPPVPGDEPAVIAHAEPAPPFFSPCRPRACATTS